MGRLVSPNGLVVGVENRQSLVDLARVNIEHGDADLFQSGTVSIRLGDGWTGQGFSTDSFDAIHVGAAAERIPDTLLKSLKSPGRMVIPVGPQWGSQTFMIVDKARDGTITQQELMSVMYVPLERPEGAHVGVGGGISPRSRGL
jgi:protein-L-isoaspartate(D-aspartate) O-methyltransferase